MTFPVHFTARVLEIIRHTKDIFTYRLEPMKRVPRFRPGQFVHLALDPYDPSAHWPDSRVFSIASGPSQKTLELTIGRQGKFTSRILDEVEVGRELSLKGPYGEFSIAAQDPEETLVLIAGGTGVTPFCSLLQEIVLKKQAPAKCIHLFYGARAASLLIYRELCEAAAAACESLQVHYVVEECPAEPGSMSLGRLDVGAMVSALENRANARFFISGPQGMIDKFSKELTEGFHIQQDHVHFDSWE